jgi:transposase
MVQAIAFSGHRCSLRIQHIMLVETAWQGVYRSPTIRAYFERVLHGRHERRKIALVATAHYLLRCMHAILVSGKPWHEAA